jgi:hypothetical protein
VTTVVPTLTLCGTTQVLVLDVSNPWSSGQITVTAPDTAAATSPGAFELIDSSVVGVGTSSPIAVVAVHVASDVGSVQAGFADGSSDQMTVQGGWAVLANDGGAPLPASITALDSSGNDVGNATVSSDDAIAEPDRCLLPFTAVAKSSSSRVSVPPTAK